jgi:hypothetical protein
MEAWAATLPFDRLMAPAKLPDEKNRDRNFALINRESSFFHNQGLDAAPISSSLITF